MSIEQNSNYPSNVPPVDMFNSLEYRDPNFLLKVESIILFKLKQFGIQHPIGFKPFGKELYLPIPIKEEKLTELLNILEMSSEDFEENYFGILYQLNEFTTNVLTVNIQDHEKLCFDNRQADKDIYPDGYNLFHEMFDNSEVDDFILWLLMEYMRPIESPENTEQSKKQLHKFFENYHSEITILNSFFNSSLHTIHKAALCYLLKRKTSIPKKSEHVVVQIAHDLDIIPPFTGGAFEAANGNIFLNYNFDTVRARDYYLRAVKKGIAMGISVGLGLPVILPACIIGTTLIDVFLENVITTLSRRNATFFAIHELCHKLSASSTDRVGWNAKVGFLPFHIPVHTVET